MRILLIPSWYPTPNLPLKGSFFQEQAQFLNGKEGIDIQILYGNKKSTTLLHWIWIFLKSWFKTTWSISKEKILQDPPAFCFQFPINGRVPDYIQIKLEKRLFFKAYQSLIKAGWKPELIHAQSGMDAGIYAHHLSKIAKIAYVIIEHQVVIFHYYSKIRASQVLQAYKAAKKLGAVSYSQKRQILMHESNCEPIIIPNLVDETKFSLNNHTVNTKLHILTIMYSHPIKGYHTFFEAMKILKDNGENFKFFVVGKGGELFSNELRNLGIDRYGELIEKVGRGKIMDLFHVVDIYVCSSDFETFGIAPREAMMCGLPVVSTLNGGVEDSINEKTGRLVQVRDSLALANSILHVKENYEKFNPAEIREYAISQFGRRLFLNKMIEFYGIK